MILLTNQVEQVLGTGKHGRRGSSIRAELDPLDASLPAWCRLHTFGDFSTCSPVGMLSSKNSSISGRNLLARLRFPMRTRRRPRLLAKALFSVGCEGGSSHEYGGNNAFHHLGGVYVIYGIMENKTETAIIYWGYIGVIYGDNRKENGNYWLG